MSSAYSSKELVLAKPLAEATITNAQFRCWLSGMPGLAEATHDPTLQSSLRSQSMKNPYWFNYWCGTCERTNRHGCKVGTGLETDIFLLFSQRNRTVVALHIEVKRSGDKLRHGQAISYRNRAKCWADPARRPRTVPPHQQARTVLAHGDCMLSDQEIAAFDRIVTHDEIARWLPNFL